MRIDEFAKEKYISLATFKKDGSKVATPVWVARDGDRLSVITDAGSGTAKRLRNSSRAQIAPCDMRGNVSGDYVDATAMLMDDLGTDRVNTLISRKYGLMARVFGLMGSVRRLVGRGGEQRVGVEMTLS